MPQPSAVTRSASSLFSRTLAIDAFSALSTLPRSGRIAWRVRSRPCLAEPPAESPSTMKISVAPGVLSEQSDSLPGSVSRAEVALLRITSCCAARLASRARAASTARATICSATDCLLFSQCSSAGRTCAVDRGQELGVVQAILGLALELRLLDEDAEHARPGPRAGPRR